MSISNQTSKSGPFVFTGSPQVIPTGFAFQLATDLLVLDYGTSAVTHDPALVLVLGSDYTVGGGGYNGANEMQTGSITVLDTGANNVQVGDNLIIMRNSPLNQLTSLLATGPLTIALIEQALDKMATLSQQLNELGARTLHFENFETISGTLSLSARAGFLLGFDDNGNIAFTDASGSGGGTLYTAGTGLLLAANQFSVNPAQTLTDLTVINGIIGSLLGNASTSTALQTSRNINGVAFNGTADITVTAAAGTLTGATLNATVTAAPGLLSAAVGTFGNMAIQNKTAVQITGGTITGMPSPTAASDVATKAYADSLATGIVQRTGVQVASTANIASLSGEQTIDGVLTSASRILVKNQTLSQNNGIYVTAAGAWTRATDSDTVGELLVGYYYFVSLGTTQGSTGWTIQTSPAVLGTNPLVFAQFSASTSYTAGTGISLVGNVFANTGVLSSTGTANEITVSASTGAVTFSLPTALTFTGKTVTGGTFNATALNGPLNGSVGAVTPSSGAFSSLTATGTITSTTTGGLAFSAATVGTTNMYMRVANVGGGMLIGTENNAGGSVVTGTSPYDSFMTGGAAIAFSATNAASVQVRLTASALTANVPYAINSNANLRTTKGNFHLTINVKDYGAIGDGVTNDTAAVNSAIAALTNYSALYFPPGNYLCSAAITAISSLSNVTIYGEGARITNSAGINSNTLVVNPTCDAVIIRDLYLAHTAATRGTGCAIRQYADNSIISNCIIDGSGEFGVLISNESGGVNDNSTIDNCLIKNTQGDGLHIGAVTNCRATNLTISNTGDDGIGLIDDLNVNSSNRVLIANINMYNIGTLGTSGVGVRVCEASDVLISNVVLNTSKEAGIYVTRFASTTDYNSRVLIQNCQFYNTCTLSGPRGAIWAEWTNDLTIQDCVTNGNTNGYGICLLDCNDVRIDGNTVKTPASRGIGTDDSTTTNVAATWTRWTVTNNLVDSNTANEAYYFVPAATKALANLLVLGNSATNVPAGNYIFTNRLATAAKVANNTSLEARTVANGGSGTAPTTQNNF